MKSESSNDLNASVLAVKKAAVASIDSSNNHDGTIPSPSSTQKRAHKKRKSTDARLRKLYRRCTSTPQGITSRTEWEELMELHAEWKMRHSSSTSSSSGDGQGKEKYASVLPGPSITVHGDTFDIRNGEWQSSKVSDHRDILVNLLFGCTNNDVAGTRTGPSKKKRKKQTTENGRERNSYQNVNVPSLPSWANIGNLASMGGVAVIEVEINDAIDASSDSQTECSLMPSQLLKQPSGIWETMLPSNSTDTDPNNNNMQVKRIIGAACKVKMFQGDHPRCISDQLMFLPPPSLSQLDGKRSDNDKDLFKLMHELKLTPKQLQSEGYPRRIHKCEAESMKESSESYSKVERTKEIICSRAKSFWEQFNLPDQTTSIPPCTNTLEIVETLSIKEAVCCMGDMVVANDDTVSKSEFYVETFLHDKNHRPRIFALDCEMVQTSIGSELARVSVVMLVSDEKGNYSVDESKVETAIVLDELVKPRRPILDYLTEYSGITPTMLIGVNTTIEDVQAHLLSLIQATDLIVGHSLENDLKALRIIHCNVVDTSVIFRGGNGRKYGLRHLTNVLLKKQIQNSLEGHCSTEDAEAALSLATSRAKLGNAFQLRENSRGKSLMRTFQTINRESTEDQKDNFAQRSTGPCVCIGSNEWISKYAKSDGSQHVLSCESIMSSMSMAIPSWLSSSTSGRRADFLWANVTCDIVQKGTKRENEIIKKLEEIMRDMCDRVPLHTPILMIFQRNYKQALAVTRERKTALKSTTMMWLTEQEQKWQQCMDTCMNCEAIWIVGRSNASVDPTC